MGAAQSPRPPPPVHPLAMPPCGGVRTSLRSGYSGGLSPTPQTPQRRPQRALAQGLMPSLRSGYQLLRAITLFGSDTSARRWCSLVPRCAPARRLCLRLVAMSSRLEFSCA